MHKLLFIFIIIFGILFISCTETVLWGFTETGESWGTKYEWTVHSPNGYDFYILSHFNNEVNQSNFLLIRHNTNSFEFIGETQKDNIKIGRISKSNGIIYSITAGNITYRANR